MVKLTHPPSSNQSKPHPILKSTPNLEARNRHRGVIFSIPIWKNHSIRNHQKRNTSRVFRLRQHRSQSTSSYRKSEVSKFSYNSLHQRKKNLRLFPLINLNLNLQRNLFYGKDDHKNLCSFCPIGDLSFKQIIF